MHIGTTRDIRKIQARGGGTRTEGVQGRADDPKAVPRGAWAAESRLAGDRGAETRRGEDDPMRVPPVPCGGHVGRDQTDLVQQPTRLAHPQRPGLFLAHARGPDPQTGQEWPESGVECGHRHVGARPHHLPILPQGAPLSSPYLAPI